MIRMSRRLLVLPLLLQLGGCFGYRLVRPDEVQVPSYEPREVLVPAECDRLIQRAGSGDVGALSEAQARMLTFCQHQQMIRAQEEEAVARKLEAHAQAAQFGLQVVSFVIAGTVAVLTWIF